MARLLNLPDELVLGLSNQLMPVDQFNLGLTCKRMSFLIPSATNEDRRLSPFRVPTLWLQGSDPWEMLEKILDDWKIGATIKALEATRHHSFYNPLVQSIEEQANENNIEKPEEALARRFVDAITPSLHLPKSHRAYLRPDNDVQTSWTIEECLTIGAVTPILALLISKMPNLEDLSLPTQADHDYLLEYILSVAEVYSTAPKTVSHGLPLQHLKYVNLCLGPVDYEWIPALLQLPAVEMIFVLGPTGNVQNWKSRYQWPNRPNLTLKEFAFNNFDANASYLESIIASTGCLEGFRLKASGAFRREEVPGPCRRALLEHASETLEWLLITDASYFRTPTRCQKLSLRGFKCLKVLSWSIFDLLPVELHLESRYLDDSAKEILKNYSIAELLPESLVTLTIGDYDECDHTVQLIQRMLREDLALVPNLSFLSTDPKGSEETLIAELCESAGIEWG